jgi:hypothetical protein|nr:MAG TPA: HAD domain protein [Caudoviricetes sp.]
MKVIFLDFDGVVNTITDKYSMSLVLHCNLSNGNRYRCDFDPRLIYNFIKLLEICNNNNIHIVISSTWRYGTTAKDWNIFFNESFGRPVFHSILKNNLVIGVTETEYADRGIQIQHFIDKWNDENIDKITDYLCIDDDTEDIIPYHDEDKVLNIDSTEGLKDINLTKIINRIIVYNQHDYNKEAMENDVYPVVIISENPDRNSVMFGESFDLEFKYADHSDIYHIYPEDIYYVSYNQYTLPESTKILYKVYHTDNKLYIKYLIHNKAPVQEILANIDDLTERLICVYVMKNNLGFTNKERTNMTINKDGSFTIEYTMK